MFSINQPLFLQKTKPLYPYPPKIFGKLGFELGIEPLCVRALNKGAYFLALFYYAYCVLVVEHKKCTIAIQ